MSDHSKTSHISGSMSMMFLHESTGSQVQGGHALHCHAEGTLNLSISHKGGDLLVFGILVLHPLESIDGWLGA